MVFAQWFLFTKDKTIKYLFADFEIIIDMRRQRNNSPRNSPVPEIKEAEEAQKNKASTELLTVPKSH